MVPVQGGEALMKDTEINNYIQNLDVANVLAVDLSLENHNYIDPSIAQAYRRTLEHQKDQPKQKTTQIPASFSSDSVRFDVPGIPPIPEGADPKKTCPFCQRSFSHPGSMGRHLDLKKGTKSHPAEIIEKMRADVKRRGDADKVKERRRIRARKYNAREDVRERTRVQRRERERVQRAKRREIKKFFEKMGRPHLQPHPTFPRLVLYFLSPSQWPQDPPTLETYRLLCGSLNDQFLPSEDMILYDDIMQKVHTASENWLTLSDNAKQDIWHRELRSAAEDALQNTSLFELRNIDAYVTKRARIAVANNEDGDEHNDSNTDDDDNEDHNDDNREKEIYNQEELAAVAEALVNNNKDHVNLDPQLIN
jgi:hypothetical protein